MKILGVGVLCLVFSVTQAQAFNTSHYGRGDREYGKRTACGNIHRPGNTTAHRTLPCGTRVRVTSLSNGRSEIVTVTDRGPAKWTGRTWDLNSSVASRLGISGVGNVRAEVLK